MEFPFGDFSDLPISRFESMLKTNEIKFFDASEFEEIGQYYIDAANLSMAKKPLKLDSTNTLMQPNSFYS